MNTYDGLSAMAQPLTRYRQHRPSHRMTAVRTATAHRDLATVAHIPGDYSTDDIERRYQAALREIRWRRCVEHPA